MSPDIFTGRRARRARWTGYLHYLANTLISLSVPPLKYFLLGRILGGLGDKTVIEPGVFFSGFGEIFLGRDVFVGRGTSLYAYSRPREKATIRVGDHVLIAPHVMITTLGHDYRDPRMPNRCDGIVIESRAWIGTGAVILPGVVIHEGAVVAAGAVVTASVPPWTIAAGCPARVIKNRPAAVSGGGVHAETWGVTE